LVAVLATDVGHSVPLLLSKGFALLREVCEPCTSPASKTSLVFAFDAVLPLFYSCPSELAGCEPWVLDSKALDYPMMPKNDVRYSPSYYLMIAIMLERNTLRSYIIEQVS
jgi:hypothetical protein